MYHQIILENYITGLHSRIILQKNHTTEIHHGIISQNYPHGKDPRDPQGLPGGPLEPPGTAQALQPNPFIATHHPASPETSQTALLSWTDSSFGPCGPPGPLWSGPLLAGPLWAHLGPYGPVPSGPGPYGPPWALMGRTLIGPPGPLWAERLRAPLGPYGPGPYGRGPYGPSGPFS